MRKCFWDNECCSKREKGEKETQTGQREEYAMRERIKMEEKVCAPAVAYTTRPYTSSIKHLIGMKPLAGVMARCAVGGV